MASTKRKRTLVYAVGSTLEEIPKSRLPTSRQVLQRYFHQLKMGMPGFATKHSAATETVREVIEIWDKARIPTMEERNIVRKLERMVGKWELLKKHEKKKTDNQKAKEAAFQGHD